MSVLMEAFCQSVTWAGIIVMLRWYADDGMVIILVSYYINLNFHACEILISSTVGEVYPSYHLFPSSSYLAQEFMCNGTENLFSQCGYNRSISPGCFTPGNHSAAVICRQGIVVDRAFYVNVI